MSQKRKRDQILASAAMGLRGLRLLQHEMLADVCPGSILLKKGS